MERADWTIAKRRRRTAAGLLLTVSMLAACGSSAEPPAAASPAALDGEPVQGGTLEYRAAGGGRSIDPATSTGYGLAVPLRTLVDSLVFNTDDGGFEPWLATDWTVNEDATHYTFELREDATFSNGEPVDAAAVAASFQALRDGGASYAVANSWIGDLAEITTPEDHLVEFHFASPNSSFLQAASTSLLGIVAPETAALDYDERQQGVSIIGSGPFVAAENRNEEGYRLERRDDYAWAPPSSPNQGPAYLDAIEVHHVNDNSIAAAELRSGGLHLLHNTEPADKTELSTNPDVTIRTEPLPGSALGLVVNPEEPALQEEEVRRALSLAIDREAVLDRASAIDIPATGVFTASNPYWEDLSELIVTDREEATRLLDDAGWVPGPDGVRAKDGERLSFDLIYSASTISHEPNLAVVQSQWRDLGVELSFGSLTTPDLNQRLSTGNYSFAWASGTRPDVDVLRSNYGGVDPELDALFEQILATPDEVARQELSTSASEIILERAYYIPLYDFMQPLAYRNELALPLYEASHIPWLGSAWLAQ